MVTLDPLEADPFALDLAGDPQPPRGPFMVDDLPAGQAGQENDAKYDGQVSFHCFAALFRFLGGCSDTSFLFSSFFPP